jgi:hypothetical protein
MRKGLDDDRSAADARRKAQEENGKVEVERKRHFALVGLVRSVRCVLWFGLFSFCSSSSSSSSSKDEEREREEQCGSNDDESAV